MPKEITQNYLQELFSYHDGILYWNISKPGMRADKIAGTLRDDGYHSIMIDNKLYKRSRLVFCFNHGYFPENEVDHIDRIRNNDRMENLREVSRQCNMRNTGNFAHNTSGVKGVSWMESRRKWYVQIKINTQNKNIGRYSDFDEAVCARLAGEQCVNWSGCDSNSPAYKYVKNMFDKAL